MTKNQTARSETAFNDHKIRAKVVDIVFLPDCVVFCTPSSSTGHGILLFIARFSAPEVTDCLQLVLNKIKDGH